MGEVWIVPDAHPDVGWLKGELPQGATVLALNIHALVACGALGGRVTSVEDWVPYGEITALADRAVQANSAFGALACGGERWNGYDLPAIAWQEQAHFFRDVLLAERLGHALMDAGVARVVWAGAVGTSAVRYAPTYDAVAALLRAILGRRFVTQFRNEKRREDLLEKQRARVALRMAVVKRDLTQRMKLPPRAKVVACFSGKEWARYTDAYADLAARHGAQFQFWSMGLPPPEFHAWAGAHGTELYRVGYPDRVQKGITSFFDAQWRAWVNGRRGQLADAVGCEWLGTGLFDFHFRPTFTGIWTHLAEWTRTLERFFAAAEPQWVVASSDHVPSWSLPRYVALKLGVRTVALPHTYVPEGDAPIVSDYVACRNRLAAEILVPHQAAKPQAWLVRNAANALSYTSAGELALKASPRRVAMLVSDEDTEGTLMAKINRRAFLETFAELLKPPADVSAFQFVYKSHPRADVTMLLQGMTPLSENVIVLEPQRSVTDLIASAWLVVLVNYFGSASLEAALLGKPMLVLDTAGNYYPGRSRLPLESGEVIETVSKFWETLCELSAVPERYTGLRAKGQAFAERWLGVPTELLGDVM